MKPFTLRWWLFWYQYAHEMFIDFDITTDEIELGEIEVETKDEDYYWKEWKYYKDMYIWIENRIIKKYGEKP